MSLRCTMYRCSRCGKWSHAQRRPLVHSRWIREDEGKPGEDDKIISNETGGYQGEDFVPGGWLVECGPFDTYEAVKVS